MQIWDTAGQERFRAINSAYYRSSAGIILCYDCTKKYTFENISNWLKQIEEVYTLSNAKLILIGNKTDLNYLKNSFHRNWQSLR